MISVFKTDIEPWQEGLVVQLLRAIPSIMQIDLDFEDCDNVLRIETSTFPHEIEPLLSSAGFTIEELE